MCGRYYVDDETVREIEKLVRQIDEKIQKMSIGDVYPTKKAPVIVGRNEEFAAELFSWGFPHFQNKGVIFNARAETAMEKRLFKESVSTRRCVVPMKAFYEWNKEKEKYTFSGADGNILYLAGCYDQYEGGCRFVILTTQANDSMIGIHHRMPLVLEEDQLNDWIYNEQGTEDILRQTPRGLTKTTEYEQQKMDFQ